MLKKCLVGLFAVAALSGARTFAAENISFDQGVRVEDVKQVIQSVKAAAENSATPISSSMQDRGTDASWNIMVYINAKNNLESYGVKDTNEMEMIGSSDKVKITVELGRLGDVSADGGWKGHRRYVIQKDNDINKISSPVLQDIDLDKADMGNWSHLVEFVNWAKATAPAQHYMLIVWNHGSGWNKTRAAIGTLGISYDDGTGHHITTQQLGEALAAVGKVDVYGSDACLMQMAEVGYQIRNYADFIVGSEETEPGDGYTYNTMLAPIVAQPAMAPVQAAQTVVKAYTAHYASINQGATQSALRSATLSQLIPLLNGWTDAVIAANEKALVKTALEQTQDFYYSDNKDLLHFIKLVGKSTKNAGIKKKGAELEKFLSTQVISANATNDNKYANAFGLAIYLPKSGYANAYLDLAWAKDSGWAKFLQWLKAI